MEPRHESLIVFPGGRLSPAAVGSGWIGRPTTGSAE